MLKKRGQVAMEFLLTYGWAILVVLLVIGALIYFGILNQRGLLPSKCDLDAPLFCVDKQVMTDGTIKILVRNGNPNAIQITEFTFEDTEGFLGGSETETPSDMVIPSGGEEILESDSGSVSADEGDKIKVGIVIDYTDTATSFTHVSTGEMLVAVEEGSGTVDDDCVTGFSGECQASPCDSGETEETDATGCTGSQICCV